ncbi:MAG: DUF433 domain-containing protein [Isosphaeraceae bacterium]
MSRAEKDQLSQWVARDLGTAVPGIEGRPDVCGGEPWIIRIRIPVWALEQTRHLGGSKADLLRIDPTLRTEDLVNAWIFVRAHRDKIEENEAA